jgi:structural maintenance of chromosome 4
MHPLSDKMVCSEDDDEEPELPPECLEGQVKAEPGEETVVKTEARARTPSYELHIYNVEELSRFKKREMIADAELLDGKLLHHPHSTRI